MIALSLQIRYVRMLDTAASGTFKVVVGPAGRRRPLLTMWAGIIGLVYLAGLFVALQISVLGMAPWSVIAVFLWTVVVVIPWGSLLLDERRKRKEDRRGLRRPRALAARCAELARDAGPGYVLTDFLSARDDTGAGVALIQSLQSEWAATGAVVVLYAATDDLVGYYRRIGATQDIPGERRMIFDFRRGRHG